MVNYNNTLLREEYISRINKVQDYIEANISEELSLITLSTIANFSQYHFHRIFCTLVGEPISKYIQRIRLEKAAVYLVVNPKDSVSQIAFKCGFSNHASFSRAFKKHFGFSASQLRADTCLQESKKCKEDSKQGKDSFTISAYNKRKNILNSRQPAANISYTIEVKNIQEMPVIYIRKTGLFKEEPELFSKLLGKLYNWAEARGLVQFPDTKILSVYHDTPEVTDEDKFRTSICITVQGEVKAEGEIGKMTIPGGKYAVGHFILDAGQYQEAWDAVYGIWLPESGYQPDDRPYFEHYLNNPKEHPEKKCFIDLYMPVKLL